MINPLIQTKAQCMLYSFAMALNTSVEELIAEIGHDGIPGGFHHQEFYPSCYSRGFAPVVADLFPQLGSKPGEPIWPIQTCVSRFLNQSEGYNVVLKTLTHAVAMDDSRIIYDPNGGTKAFDYSEYQTGIILVRIKST